MPILLTTPKMTGDLDPDAQNGQYAELKIIQQMINTKAAVIELVLEYGNTVDGSWVSGISKPERVQISDGPPQMGCTDAGDPEATPPVPANWVEIAPATTDYTDLLSSLPTDANELIYDGAARVLYQWLIDKGLFAGTIL